MAVGPSREENKAVLDEGPTLEFIFLMIGIWPGFKDLPRDHYLIAKFRQLATMLSAADQINSLTNELILLCLIESLKKQNANDVKDVGMLELLNEVINDMKHLLLEN